MAFFDGYLGCFLLVAVNIFEPWQFCGCVYRAWVGFSGGSEVKNPFANAGDARSVSLIPGSGRSSGNEVATHSKIPAWRIPWTEKPGGLQSMGSHSQTQLSTHTLQGIPLKGKLLGKGYVYF